MNKLDAIRKIRSAPRDPLFDSPFLIRSSEGPCTLADIFADGEGAADALSQARSMRSLSVSVRTRGLAG